MKVLTVGDIVGENGLEKLKKTLPDLVESENIDFVIVNAENSAGGMGITKQNFQDLMELKVDAITMGNHTWGKKDIFSFIDHKTMIRPANYSKGVVGKGYRMFECKGKRMAVINLIGRTDMNILSENPFLVVDDLLREIVADYIFVDFHAEATAEKIAMKYYLDGRVSVLFGTHTHVQTSDEEITEKGMGYITDIGMTGPVQSVIGMDVNVSIKRFVTSLPERYKLAEGKCELNGCMFEMDDENGRTKKVVRLNRM